MATLDDRAEKLYSAPAWRPNRWNVSLAIVLAILGLVVSLQWRQEPNTSPDDSPSRSISDTAVGRLEEDQKRLKAQIGTLQKQIQELQQVAGSRKDNLSGISRELERQKGLSGIVGLNGPGVRVTLDDSTMTPADSDDPSHYLVHEYQLRDVVNLLWRGGAEAISINGERIVGITSVYCVGSTIMVNSTRMSPPYEILAIGDQSSLEGILSNPNYLRQLKSEARQYGVQFTTERLKGVSIPPYNGVFILKYAAPSSQQ